MGIRYTYSEKLKEAILFADNIHKNQVRKGSNIPYMNHPIKVCENVLKYVGKDKDIEKLLIVSVLHDTLEDTSDLKDTSKELLEKFGIEVFDMVYSLTSDKKKQKELGKTTYLSLKLRDMNDDVLIIKLCDRLSNIDDLESSNDKDFISKYIDESIGILSYQLYTRDLSDIHKIIIRDILDRIRLIDDSKSFIVEDLLELDYIDDDFELKDEFIRYINRDELRECSYVKKKI